MNIFIDLEQSLVVSDFTNRTPLDSISIKSQDTPLFAVYFVQRGVNYDLGASPGLRFGLFQAGNPNPLVACNSFVRGTDNSNRVCYRGYPNFNTTALAAAVGPAGILAALGEFRFQTSGGTISRTQDVDFNVQRVLLSETIIDNTTAAFTTPAVGSNVTVAIGSTSWLTPGLILSIGAGAGNYTVVSITDATHFVAQNNGGTGNAASGTNIPSGTTVGIAPATVISTYPDPSVIEITPHKGAANGYAGLDATGLVLASKIPVDGQTVVALANGKIGAGSIITYTSANFTTPAASATVSVTLQSTSSLHVGQYVRIPIAGYYVVQSITDSTHAVLQNNADPFNAASGTTITSGAVLLPAQAAAGGGAGSPGQNAYSTTSASFVVPAIGATVIVPMGSTSWLGGSGYVVFIANAGYYAVSSVTDGSHAVLTNLGYLATNAASGTTIPSGSMVTPGGVKGSDSTATGSNAYDATSASFVMPAAAAAVSISISNTAWVGVGQEIFIQGAGYFSVASITSPTVFSATNSNYPGAAAPGSTIASGAKVSPAGVIGPQGAGGAGLNAYTTLTSNFTQPAAGSTVTVVVGSTAWIAPTQNIYIQGGGYYSVSSIGDLTHVTVTNLGTTGNPPSGTTITGSGTQTVSPAGTPGITGGNAYTATTASFTQPAISANVTVAFANTGWMAQNQYVFINGGGYYQVVAIGSSTSATIQNIGSSGNLAAGSSVPTNAAVSPAGPIGVPGATGPSGGISDAPSDGNLYGRKNAAWSVVSSGGGGPFDPQAAPGLWTYTDFLSYSNTATEPFVSGSSFGATGGWGGSTYGQDATRKVLGAYGLSNTGSVAGGAGAWMLLGSQNSQLPYLVPGLGAFTAKARISLPAALPSGAAATLQIGIMSAPVTANLGVFGWGATVEFAPDTNANWRLGHNSTGVNGSTSYTNTSTVPVIDSPFWVELDMDATWANCTVKVGGTTLGTITGLSLGTNLLGFYIAYGTYSSSALSSNAVVVDSMFQYYNVTR